MPCDSLLWAHSSCPGEQPGSQLYGNGCPTERCRGLTGTGADPAQAEISRLATCPPHLGRAGEGRPLLSARLLVALRVRCGCSSWLRSAVRQCAALAACLTGAGAFVCLSASPTPAAQSRLPPAEPGQDRVHAQNDPSSPGMTSGNGNSASTVAGTAPQNGENKPPQAIVKPQVLTHVIEGFVIQEGAEPFPVRTFFFSPFTLFSFCVLALAHAQVPLPPCFPDDSRSQLSIGLQSLPCHSSA